ncbi:ATP-binding cassette domain-containing protein [Agrobacterium sp. RAC06]|uniref:ATP-binding cassette domain-containing protein n=1 Tax=Agrobacterium sp. RAC06 TaxID=1842536 RepID=UPI00083D91B8|nr:ATP-binding cassette domain-containing protein [Agrobacterium sp. RAC06]AOG10654.1 ABC transporter family protein [Agrobacterium sp. RAC06]
MIDIVSLSKAYGASTVLDDFSLTFLAKGGLTAIIGPNGAGKSTLLSIIARLMLPDAGTVHLEGLDVFQAKGELLAQRLSILRQDNHMAARFTVSDLVAFSYSNGRLTVADKAKIDEALAHLKLRPLADRYLDELSGGQRQRAFFAMILCQDSDYTLFDEPLNNLDIPHGVAMMAPSSSRAGISAKPANVGAHKLFPLILEPVELLVKP